MTTRVLRGLTARPDPARAQPTCGSAQALARVRLAPFLSRQVFERQLRTIPAVRSALYVIGDVDYELRLECRAIAEWIADEGMSLDVCSASELAVARSVGFPRRPDPAARERQDTQ
jgi:hypothetical protein